MGNHQSKPNQNRLSKPKTNTNSPSPVQTIDSPASVTSRYADLSASGRQHIKETLLSPVDTETGTDARTNTDDGAEDLMTRLRGRSASLVSRSNSRTNSRSNSISCFGSKQGSLTKLAGFADSKLSPTSNNPGDLEAAIKLLQEMRKTASPEDLAALHEALEPTGEHVVPVSEQSLSRNPSLVHRSSSSLTRRRSLIQTPGVATRHSPVEGRRKTWNSWRAPQLQPDEEAKWKGPPAMVHLSVCESSAKGQFTAAPRAHTPSDLDYSHLGSMKPGTLMVTNGAPSPVPSAKALIHMPRPTIEDDYFSVPEAGDLMLKIPQRRGHAKSQSAVLPSTFPLYNDVPLLATDKMGTQQIYNQARTFQRSRTDGVRSETLNASSLQVTTDHTDHYAQSASQFAQSYQQDLPSSPFTSCNTGSGRDGDFASLDTHARKEEPSRIIEGTMFELDATTEIKNSAPPVSPSRMLVLEKQGYQASHRPPPQTTDSGYSSGGSLRTSHGERQGPAISSASAPKRESMQKREDHQERPLPKSILSRSSIQFETVQDSQPLVGDATQVRRRPVLLDIANVPARSSGRFSGSESTLSPQTPNSVASKASFDSTSSTQKRMLYKKRPSQPEVPVVQSCQPIPEGTIPEVPDNVRAKFVRRLSNSPGMECLTNTYMTKEHVLVNELPVSTSPEVAQEHSQQGTQEIKPARLTKPEFDQLAELEPDRPPTPPAHGRRRSRSLFRRKSTAAEDTDTVALNIVDLGTIAASLGTSPYDAAMPGPLKKSLTSPTHPHQLGSNTPRAKSMVSMDSEAAAEFARMRSRDRAMIEFPPPQRRRKSHHNIKLEAGEATASKRRPQSSAGDIPPVPSIDTFKHVTPPPDVSQRNEREQKALKSELSYSQSRERRQVVSQSVDFNQHAQRLPQHNVDWNAHASTWSRRRKSIGEGLRTNIGITDASASTVNARAMPQAPESVESWGRFSGGLDYGYEGRGMGVGGSAGTRQLNSCASSKSMNWRVQHGVDLSDVPIMLQRV